MKDIVLTGKQIGELRDALVDAFPSYAALKQMLHLQLEKKLEELVAKAGLKDSAYEIIILAQAEGWVRSLLSAAQKANPGNAKLKALVNELLPENEKESDIDGITIELELAPEKQEKTVQVSIENQLDSLLGEIASFFDTLSSRKPEYDWFSDSKKNYTTIKGKWDERRFQVAVMALMKSGKSTLLNSWIGNEFLPSAAIAETMKTVILRHNQNNKKGKLFINNKEVATGRENIKKYIQQINKAEREKNEGSGGDFRLEIAMSSLKGKPLEGYGFDFLDTPGVNESGVPILSGKIELLIKNSDVIIYVLDVTKLKSNDERDMFRSLKEWKIELFKELGHRLFFVVNKMDTLNRHDREKDLSEETIRIYIKNILKDDLEIEVDETNIIPVSSEQALLSRLVATGEASTEQMLDFKKIAFGRAKANKVSDKECLEAVDWILEDSGIEELERKVLSVIYKNRSKILIDSVSGDSAKLLNQIANNLDVGKGALLKEANNIIALKKRIIKFQNELKNISQDSDEFKKKAFDSIDKKIKAFKKNIKEIVISAFSTSGAKPRFPWVGVITDTFGTTTYVIKETDWGIFQQRLNDISNLINIYIENNFSVMLNQLIDNQYKDFLQFRDKIEGRSKPLVGKIEKEINETLDILLIPNSIRFYKPTLDSFYKAMGFSIQDITTSKTKSNLNFFERLINRIIQFLGGDGFDEHLYKEYRILSTDYINIVIPSIAPELEYAQEKMEKFISAKYIEAVNSTIKDIKNYSNNYIRIMEKEIDMKKDKVVDIPLRIENMEEDLAEAKELIELLHELKKDK